MNTIIINDTLEEYYILRERGLSQRQACDQLRIARSTLQGWLKVGPITKEPKVTLLDIETSPTISANFQRWKVNVNQDSVVSEGGVILTAAWKQLGSKKVESTFIQDPEQRWNGNDSDVVAQLWEVIEDSDVIITQNGKNFDIPVIKSRLAFWGMSPLKNVKHVDTLAIAKSMRFNANSLDSLGSYLGVGRKMKHEGISLWLEVMKGDPDALDRMLDYNAQDVELLEAVYMKIRAFDQRPPQFGHLTVGDKLTCPACGSHDVNPTGKTAFTPVSSWVEYQCEDCGHRSRGRVAQNTKGQRSNILMGV